MYDCLCRHVFIPLLYLGVELLDHTVVVILAIWGTARLFLKKAIQFYIPNSIVQGMSISPHPYQHLLSSDFMITVMLLSRTRYLTVVLMCISQITNNVKHLLTDCLLTICISLKKCIFKWFVHLQDQCSNPGAMEPLCPFKKYILTHLLFTRAIRYGWYSGPYFTHKETKAVFQYPAQECIATKSWFEV